MGKASGKKVAATRPGKHKRAGAAGTVDGHGTVLWWGGLGCGAMVVLSPASAVLLAVLVLPVLLVAMLPDDSRSRRIATAALLFGLAGSVHPLRQLWDGGGTMSAATTLMHQPLMLLTSWMSVLAGWFVGELAIIVLNLVADLDAASKRRRYAAELAALEEEWGTLLPILGMAAM